MKPSLMLWPEDRWGVVDTMLANARSPPVVSFTDLLDEMIEEIYSHLDLASAFSLSWTCRSTRRVLASAFTGQDNLDAKLSYTAAFIGSKILVFWLMEMERISLHALFGGIITGGHIDLFLTFIRVEQHITANTEYHISVKCSQVTPFVIRITDGVLGRVFRYARNFDCLDAFRIDGKTLPVDFYRHLIDDGSGLPRVLDLVRHEVANGISTRDNNYWIGYLTTIGIEIEQTYYPWDELIECHPFTVAKILILNRETDEARLGWLRSRLPELDRSEFGDLFKFALESGHRPIIDMLNQHSPIEEHVDFLSRALQHGITMETSERIFHVLQLAEPLAAFVGFTPTGNCRLGDAVDREFATTRFLPGMASHEYAFARAIHAHKGYKAFVAHVFLGYGISFAILREIIGDDAVIACLRESEQPMRIRFFRTLVRLVGNIKSVVDFLHVVLDRTGTTLLSHQDIRELFVHVQTGNIQNPGEIQWLRYWDQHFGKPSSRAAYRLLFVYGLMTSGRQIYVDFRIMSTIYTNSDLASTGFLDSEWLDLHFLFSHHRMLKSWLSVQQEQRNIITLRSHLLHIPSLLARLPDQSDASRVTRIYSIYDPRDGNNLPKTFANDFIKEMEKFPDLKQSGPRIRYAFDVLSNYISIPNETVADYLADIFRKHDCPHWTVGSMSGIVDLSLKFRPDKK